jgi:hypothetical protein
MGNRADLGVIVQIVSRKLGARASDSHGGEKMGKQSSVIPANSRYGWRWILILLGVVSWVSIGCSPQSLTMFLMPFDDNNIQPEYPLFKTEKDITFAIITNFARPEIQPDLQAADVELAEMVSLAFRKRCEDNKHKIKLVPTVQVRSQELKQRQLTGGEVSAVDIGKSLKATYVLELTFNSLSLYEKITYPPHYRGRTNIVVSLYKVDVKDGDHKVFIKEYPRVYPSEPVEASSMTPTSFRRNFLVKVSNDIAKMFISYPPEERREMD